MKITFKRTNKQYVVTVDGCQHTFSTSKDACKFIFKTRAIEALIDEKICILYDMHILRKHTDNREQAVRQMLSSCQTDIQIENIILDVIVGNCTLNQMLKRKGVA